MTMDIPPPKAKMSKVKELADQIEYYEMIAKGGKHEFLYILFRRPPLSNLLSKHHFALYIH